MPHFRLNSLNSPVELALNLAKQRENNLTECLNRRHAMAEEVLKENLEISQRKIANKENELMSLRKDLESERLRYNEMTSKHNELVESLQTKLKAAQERCTELSSSSLCIEVGELRERIKEVLISKKITDDINEILQEELRDVREQLVIYEQSLDIVSVVEERELTPRHQLPLFHDTKGGQISTILSKTSPTRNKKEKLSLLIVPLSSTWNQEIGDRASASTPHRLFTTTTDQTKVLLSPQVDKSIGALKTELKNTLAKYKAKREQTTGLYEKLFAARCELHKAVAERDRAESARADLQVRVLALERELNLQPDTRQATPREIALTGQLERLQADYHHLEAELQMTRTRFADAQAAEARAVGAERTARERVEASISEREAAIERTRAACEAHYAAARRRIEAELTAQHENTLAQVKQETLTAREEAMAYRNELERVNAMLQEAKEATAQAVQMTMSEAIKERENERIRFWREELPHQIELARNGWLLESEARFKLNLDRVRSECQAEFDSHMAACVRQHQTELDKFRTPKITQDRAVECIPCESRILISPHEYPLLSVLFSNVLFNELASICGVEYHLPSIESYTGSFLRKAALALMKRFTVAFAQSLLAVISEYGLLKKEQKKLILKINALSDNDPVVEGLLKMLGDLVAADLSVEIEIIRKIARLSIETKNAQDTGSDELIGQIKAEVQMYVQSCQERCARTLQKGLSGAHRRACRQFTNRLRNALGWGIKELNLQPDTRQATPREIALTGQLERLQADYHHLEAELQMTRTRFADAQAAEARAVGAERTARERVEASISEREAAIERTRAACEAHYAAARRRIEAELTAQHENTLAQVKQETLTAREEAMAYRNELERVNAMLQEAKEATAQAVQMTMSEAIKERENERIRFWREELPHQIELARNGWLLESEARFKLNLDRVRSECQAEFDSHMAACVRQHQTELDKFRTPKITQDRAVECIPCESRILISPHEYPLLSVLFSNVLFNELASICGVEYHLPSIESYTGSFLRKAALALMKRFTVAFAQSLLAVISEYGLLKKEQKKLILKINALSDNDPVVEGLLKMLGDLVAADLSVEIEIIRKIARLSIETKNAQDTGSDELIGQIKAEVQMYVQSCQERCARTLQKGLSGAHRRACRQFTNRLRNALSESGLSPLSFTSQDQILNFNQPMR
nr:cation efflux protein: zinc transporter [Hymenolepis microstoma]